MLILLEHLGELGDLHPIVLVELLTSFSLVLDGDVLHIEKTVHVDV